MKVQKDQSLYTWETSTEGKIKIFTRYHINNCKLKHDHENQCSCPKYFHLYPNDKALLPKDPRVAAEAISLTDAREKAQKKLRSWTPEAQALALLKEEKESSERTIESCLESFLTECEDRLKGSSTLDSYKEVLQGDAPMSLKTWLAGYNAQAKKPVTLITDITGELLLLWRQQAWKDHAVNTRKVRWGRASSFFLYCQRHGWLKINPAHAARGINQDGEEVIAVFNLEQWTSFIRLASTYIGATTSDKENYCLRVRTFFEILYHGGLALADAVRFDRSRLREDGTYIYHRWKLRKKAKKGWATVVFPPHVVELVKLCQPEPDARSKDLLFWSKNMGIDPKDRSLQTRWWRRFSDLCDKAGITEIFGWDNESCAPHPHALRHSAAVNLLRETRDIFAVARSLGHDDIQTTQDHYTGWCKELLDDHIKICRRAAANVKPTIPVVASQAQVVEISLRRLAAAAD